MYRTNTKRDGLVCMNMDGNIMWKTGRNPNFDRGSMILADGLLLATDGLNALYLIEPDPTGFKQISKTVILKEGGGFSPENIAGLSDVATSTQNWAPMALADGKLLVRDQNRMFCIKVAQ
jgi:hypothetical protein